MLTMQQLEELENRVIKALHLIGELRTENAKLENENETLKGDIEEVKLTLEEKEQEIERIKRELDAATRELQEMMAKEDALEKKILSLLGKLDMIQTGSVPAQFYDSGTPSEPRRQSSSSVKSPAPVIEEEKDLVIESEPDEIPVAKKSPARGYDEDLKIETVNRTSAEVKSDDDDIIIIDDESEIETPAPAANKKKAKPAADEDEIILIDDEDDIIIEDMGDDEIIIEDEDVKKNKKFDDDDEIIIIEDDVK
ncbi:MAG TPA: hypothetical protein PK514_03790 [Spirochaetota bacterium]|nr:hypothetical protein [Spirochaetota bacterium]